MHAHNFQKYVKKYLHKKFNKIFSNFQKTEKKLN